MVRVLIGFEESQTVCKAFRKHNHEAYSCDIKPCSGGHPEWHFKMDIIDCLLNYGMWDLIILHPDCTKLAVSGNRWYGKGTPGHNKRKQAIDWTVNVHEIAKTKSKHIALENPVSVIFRHLDYEELQYIQPYEYGHGETKKTGLALIGLPKLKPTNVVSGREQKVWKMPPSPDRKRLRSITYPGIAEAMAKQWGNHVAQFKEYKKEVAGCECRRQHGIPPTSKEVGILPTIL